MNSIKALLILAYLACDHHAIVERFSSLGLSFSLGTFLVLYAILAVALFCASQIRNALFRCGFALAFAAGSIFQHSVEWSAGGTLTYESFLNLFHSREQAGAALEQFSSVLLKVVPIGLLLFLGIALPPRGSRVPSKIAIAAPIGALALLSAMFYVRGGEGSRALPAAFPSLSFASLLAWENLTTHSGPRLPITIARADQPVERDLVLLVDESVSGHYLDINNPKGVPTGLLTPPPGVQLFNYGHAAAIHTCSLNSNVTLRYGGTRDNYQETIAHHPSIWAYAKQAGLRTVYIDAQSNNGDLQNLMTAAERAEIDDFIQLDGVPVLDRDMHVARILAERINDGRRDFIYVNKVGAHFPIQNKFPLHFTRYQPTLPRTDASTSSWSSDRTGFTGTAPEWVQYRNSYRNTLLWNVGEFFDTLLSKADLNKATIIYTSDHGQDLHERGNPGNNTHCGTDHPLQEEGVVPLLILEGEKGQSRDWNRYLQTHHNGMSHFRIFPTLLAMMGYDQRQTHAVYGASLDDPEKDDFSFNIMFNTRLGRKPEWRRIDTASIASPPDSDWNTNTQPHMAAQDQGQQ